MLRRVVGLALAIVALIPPPGLGAQTSEPAAATHGTAIGLAPTLAWVGRPEVWPAVRVSVPIGARFVIDGDAGRMLPASNDVFSSDAIVGFAVRFLRPRHGVTRATRYWIAGPAWIVGREGRDLTGARTAILAVRLGYGVDEIVGDSIRVLAEAGVIGGGAEAPTGLYGTLAVQWVPRAVRRR